MPAKKTDASTKINKTPIKTKKTALKKAAKGRVENNNKNLLNQMVMILLT